MTVRRGVEISCCFFGSGPGHSVMLWLHAQHLFSFLFSYSGWAETVEAGNLEPQVTWTNPTFVWILPILFLENAEASTQHTFFSFFFFLSFFITGIALPPVKTESLSCKHLIWRTTWRLCVSVDLYLLGGSQACRDVGFLLLEEMTNCRRTHEKVARKAFLSFFLNCCVHAHYTMKNYSAGCASAKKLTSLSRNHSQTQYH